MNNAFGCNTEDPQQWSGVNRKSILIFSGPKTHLRALERDWPLEIRKVANRNSTLFYSSEPL